MEAKELQNGAKMEPKVSLRRLQGDQKLPICKSKLFFRAIDLQMAGCDLHVICSDLQSANQMQIM